VLVEIRGGNGSFLMNHAVNFNLVGDLDRSAVLLKRVE
jgi:hypothetical protein